MVRKTVEIHAIAWSKVRFQFKRGFVPDLWAIAFNSWPTCNYLSKTCYIKHFFEQLVLQWWLSKHCNCKGGGVTLSNEKFVLKCAFENKLAATIKQKLRTEKLFFRLISFQSWVILPQTFLKGPKTKILRPVEEVHALWIATAEI